MLGKRVRSVRYEPADFGPDDMEEPMIIKVRAGVVEAGEEEDEDGECVEGDGRDTDDGKALDDVDLFLGDEDEVGADDNDVGKNAD